MLSTPLLEAASISTCLLYTSVDTLRQALAQGLIQLVTSAVTLVSTFIMMLVLSPLLTLLIVLPLGVGAAVYLTEYASNRRLIEVIEFTNETLAGIPSILYGLVGMLVFSLSLIHISVSTV